MKKTSLYKLVFFVVFLFLKKQFSDIIGEL